jgi:hypothetical protein
MVAIFVAVGLMLAGSGFLLAAAYLELSGLYSPPAAAAILGAGLMLIAGVLWLTGRSRPQGAIAPMAQAAVGVQSGDEAVDKIVAALKQESPLTVLAAAAGLLFGLFLRGRHHG